MEGRFERFAPLTGVVFAVLFAIGLFVGGDTPATDAPGEEVIDHYKDGGKAFVAIFVVMICAVLFLFFVGVLRNALRASAPDREWLASVVFGGGVAYSIALAIFAMSQIMLIDAADLGQPQVAQALNIFDNDNFFPAVLGLTVVLLGAGLHSLGSGTFPKWLSWAAVVLGILALAGPAGFIAFLVFPIWVLIAGVMLYRAGARPAVVDPAVA